MIPLLVDEAYAFDYLSILEVKRDRDLDSKSKFGSWEQCHDFLLTQLGGDKFLKVILSPEYKDLKAANSKTFDAVDVARRGGDITAKAVDDVNMERYYAKVALQKKFFNTGMAEVKVTYGS